MAERPHLRVGTHPTAFTYIRVAALLAILTGVEVWVFYIDVLEPAFLPIFLILSVAKFALVVMFYMHLKFDDRLFSWVFVGGLMLAISVAIVLMGLFQVLSVKSTAPEGFVAASHGGEGVLPEVPAKEEPAVDVPATTESPAGTTASTTPVDLHTPPPVVAELDGKEIFMTAPPEAGAQGLWCSTCHMIESVAAGLIGPDLTHIGTEAAGRKPGTSAEDYIRESIVDPTAFVPEGVDRALAGLMTTAVSQGLRDDQVNALVEFLLQQK